MGHWVEYGPLRDGAGIYELNGVHYTIVVRDNTLCYHRAALLNGVEIARATKFSALVKKLEKLHKEQSND